MATGSAIFSHWEDLGDGAGWLGVVGIHPGVILEGTSWSACDAFAKDRRSLNKGFKWSVVYQTVMRSRGLI